MATRPQMRESLMHFALTHAVKCNERYRLQVAHSTTEIATKPNLHVTSWNRRGDPPRKRIIARHGKVDDISMTPLIPIGVART
jgi:hypothetical protein